MPKPFLKRNSSGTIYELLYSPNSWEDKEVHAFLKGISPKVNVIVQLEFKLAYYDFTVQYFNHFAMGPPFKLIIIHDIWYNVTNDKNIEWKWIFTFLIDIIQPKNPFF